MNPSTLKPSPQNTAHYGLKAQTLEGDEKGREARAGPLVQPLPGGPLNTLNSYPEQESWKNP